MKRFSPLKNSVLAADARKQRFAGLRGTCCGTRVRGSVPQPQSSSLALPCQILVSVDGCQSLAAFGSCIHWMRAPSRRPITPAGTVGKRVPSGHNRRRRLATRSSGKQQAGRTAVRAAPIVCPEESPQCARGRKPLPTAGSDVPTPAREKGLQPYGVLTLFFRWRKKSVQKKASGTATPGKSPLLPILTAGLAMSRASWLASSRLHSCALGARLFPPSKWAGLFPSAAYRRSAPPQLAVGRLTPCGLGRFDVAWIFLQRG